MREETSTVPPRLDQRIAAALHTYRYAAPAVLATVAVPVLVAWDWSGFSKSGWENVYVVPCAWLFVFGLGWVLIWVPRFLLGIPALMSRLRQEQEAEQQIATIRARVEGWRALQAQVLESPLSTPNAPLCAACHQPLPREGADLPPAPPGLPPAFLGTVCRSCARIECYGCRGGVGLPCSSCGGAVSPAYHHMFG
jgi:hypothetical protein